MRSCFFARLFTLILLALSLASCAQLRTASTATTLGPTSATDTVPTNPWDETLPDGSLILAGIKDNGLNPTDATLQFLLKTTIFGTNAGPPTLTINGTAVGETCVQVSDNQILAAVRLSDGRNDIALDAYDDWGRPLIMERTIWAGSNKLQVDLVDESGERVTGDVKLNLRLADDGEVTETLTGTGGHAEFKNIPSRPVIVEARSSDNRMGAAGAMGSDGHIAVSLLAFNKPSQVDNNDFSQGLAGWVGNGHVTLVPHVEDVGPVRRPPPRAGGTPEACAQSPRPTACR